MADIPSSNWNEADGSNTAVAPDGAPEGMAPSGLNDVLRAHQGAVKRWYNWTIPRLTAGTGTAYTLAYGVAPGALVDGMTHMVQFHAANGNAPTLNVNGLGAIPLQYYSAGAWRAVPANLFNTDWTCRVAYNAGAGAYRLLMPGAPETGEIKPFAGVTVPAGYLFCFGQAISRTAYAGLFAALGTTYGAGDGSTTFNLPDLRGRVVAGKSDMGGSDSGILTGGSVLGASLGGQNQSAGIGGSASGTLTGSTSDAISGTHVFASGGGGDATGWDHGHNVSVSGNLGLSGNTATFSIVQPSRVLNQMIRI